MGLQELDMTATHHHHCIHIEKRKKIKVGKVHTKLLYLAAGLPAGPLEMLRLPIRARVSLIFFLVVSYRKRNKNLMTQTKFMFFDSPLCSLLQIWNSWHIYM